MLSEKTGFGISCQSALIGGPGTWEVMTSWPVMGALERGTGLLKELWAIMVRSLLAKSA